MAQYKVTADAITGLNGTPFYRGDIVESEQINAKRLVENEAVEKFTAEVPKAEKPTAEVPKK